MFIKKWLRELLTNGLSLVSASFIFPGFKVELTLYTIGIGTIVLSLVHFFLKPILKLISFPINFVTLGFFSWVINVFLLYLVVYLVKGIEVTSGVFSVDFFGLSIPEIQLSWIWTLVFAAFSISIISTVIKKILF